MEQPILTLPRLNTLLLVLCLGACLSATASAQGRTQSQPLRASAGSWRVGLESTLFGHESLTIGVGDDSVFALELDRTETALGISQLAGLGPVLGYALSDDWILTGRFTVASHSRSIDDGDAPTETRLTLAPSLEYLIRTEHRAVLPYVGTGLALLLGDTSVGDTAISELSIGFTAHAGAHLFVTDAVAVTPGLMLMYRLGSAELQDSFDDAPSSTVHGFGALLTVGLSVWQ